MARLDLRFAENKSRSPRTRGDGPEGITPELAKQRVLPAHAGMARPPAICSGSSRIVLPAHAGMAPLPLTIPWSISPFSPHTRGWPEQPSAVACQAVAFSPHTRGWPDRRPAPRAPQEVLPAHAGMARWSSRWRSRGPPFSPHTRGWPVGIGSGADQADRSPRTRGDGPTVWPASWRAMAVLPAHAGMARSTAPRHRPGQRFSPHTRGWPVNLLWDDREVVVLPAHAGMARAGARRQRDLIEFSPHTRGWPVGRPAATCRRQPFSPHTRGWPEDRASGRPVDAVLPAHAGMALHPLPISADTQSSPRTRGDGPGLKVALYVTRVRSPRTRGDGPVSPTLSVAGPLFSPHTRGWPERRRRGCGRVPGSPRTRGDGPEGVDALPDPPVVLPAHAGMARRSVRSWRSSTCVLPAHAGMARISPPLSWKPPTFSPHTRGWPVVCTRRRADLHVLPAHAGMARRS